MNSARAEEILQEIARTGSDLNQKYSNWVNDQFSAMIFELMFHLSTADKVAESTDIMDGCDRASMLLGVTVGRAKSVELIQSLNLLGATPTPEVEESFGVEEEEKKESEGE